LYIVDIGDVGHERVRLIGQLLDKANDVIRNSNIKVQSTIFITFLVGLISSLGTMSIKKSNWSYLDMANAPSFRFEKTKTNKCRRFSSDNPTTYDKHTWSVRLLFSSVCTHARNVNSCMNSSAALANMIGASALIIFTSSSSFMIFLMRANGNSTFLKSFYSDRMVE
jgi:hypothetical protein